MWAGFLGGSEIKNSPTSVGELVQSLGWEDTLEKEMAIHSSILAWRISMDREAWWATVHGIRHVFDSFETPWTGAHFSVLHHLSELAQTHLLWVSDAIQPSCPLLSPSPLAFNLAQHQGLFQWVSSLHKVAKVLELQLQYQSFHLLISWLQSPSAVILEPKKTVCHCFHFFPHLFAMKWWDRMSWSYFFECWILSQLFHSSFTFIKRIFHSSSLFVVQKKDNTRLH